MGYKKAPPKKCFLWLSGTPDWGCTLDNGPIMDRQRTDNGPITDR